MPAGWATPTLRGRKIANDAIRDFIRQFRLACNLFQAPLHAVSQSAGSQFWLALQS
jgi:hypothetical protein